jgi:hypothetical protein
MNKGNKKNQLKGNSKKKREEKKSTQNGLPTEVQNPKP